MLFFMAAIKHSEKDNIINYIEKYMDTDGGYLIALETSQTSHSDTSGEHFHFAVDMNKENYDKFRKTVLVNHYRLRGQAKNGQPRQYGVIKNVRDETKFLTYMCKEKNLNNIYYKKKDLKIIQEYITNSYTKPDKKLYENILMDFLLDNQAQFSRNNAYDNTSNYKYVDNQYIPDININMLEELVLKHYINNQEGIQKVLCISRLRYYVTMYLQRYTHDFQFTILYMKNKTL